jgi:enoyl-CoA hydratase/carnithine racemase
MPEPFVQLRRAAVATVTLARAEKRNALTPGMLAELEAIARSFVDDVDTRAVVIRAEGADFSVGADLAAGRTDEDPRLNARRRRARQGARLLRSLQEIPQPTVCLVQGVATGGAACIASACDFRIAARTARIGYGEVRLGINLMWNAVPYCVRLVGPARAKRMIMTGALFDAGTLVDWGFVDETTAPEELETRGTALAEELASLPPMAVQMIKETVDAVSGAGDAAIVHADADQWTLATLSADFREGIRAFREKRPGRFSGE